MKLIFSDHVETILHTLPHDDRERVKAWFGYLRNWEQDEFVKSRSVTLNVRGQEVLMFRTSTELRIFYTVDLEAKAITVIDIATKDTIIASGAAVAGVP